MLILLAPLALSTQLRAWGICLDSSWENSHTLSSYFEVSLSPDISIPRPGLQESCNSDVHNILWVTEINGDKDTSIYASIWSETKAEVSSRMSALYSRLVHEFATLRIFRV